MATITPNGDVPQQPGYWDNSYLPDQLIAGDFHRVTQGQGVLTSGATINTLTTIPRGTILGNQTVGTATAVAKAGNTGNATSSAVTVLANAKVGQYKAVYTAATTFNVFDPDGGEIGQGVNGTPFADKIGFTMTAGGTPMVAGDTEFFNVAAGTGNFIPSVATATDGSQIPTAILVDDANPSAGNVNIGVYLTGEFNQNYITFDTSWTVAALSAAFRTYSIFLKPSNSAADPT